MPSVSLAVDLPDCSGSVAKRQKTANGVTAPASAVQASRIFTPFRTLGLVSPTPVPFSSIPLGKTTFQITTSVGRCLQTYDLRRGLNLVFLTRPQTEGNITAIASWKNRVFAAWDGGVRVGVSVFKRGKKIDELGVPDDHDQPIHQLLVFGSWIVGRCSAKIVVWKSANYEYYTTLTPPRSGGRKVSTVLSGGISSMPTFLNKIFAGRGDGGVEIWNVSTGKLIYTMLPPSPDCGGVTALQPAPALSLLAIAYANGLLIIHNVQSDETMIQLNSGQSRKSRIDSISFRTDGLGAGDDGRRAGVMATAGTDDGDVTLWDLNDGGRVMGVLRGAHNPPSTVGDRVSGGVNKVEFLPGQPIIVTCGLDNAIKSWIFDESPFSAIPHVLHSRRGHAAPVRKLHFLPASSDGADAGGKWLLSASGDRSLWAWSLRRDGQSTEMSQGNISKKAKKMGILGATSNSAITLEDLKAPEITCIAASLNMDGGMGASANSSVWTNKTDRRGAGDISGSAITGWESVITGHKGDRYARTWFWGKKKAGRWVFETGDGGEVKSVAVSPCGTFALVGSSLGSINMFNLQSGHFRQRFPPKLTPAQARRAKLEKVGGAIVDLSHDLKKFGLGEGKHTNSVTGLVVDSLNKVVISCGLDMKLKFWDFMTGLLVDEMSWSSITSISGLRHHRPSDLIALSCGDLSIRVVDVVTKKVVRELRGCAQEINDFCFSNDGRWIIAASADSIVRVWDLPTGHLIDAIRLQSTCTALSFSETGEFLATAHTEGVGINVWNNRTLFTHVPTRRITEAEVAEVTAPVASGEGGQDLIDAAFDEEPNVENLVEDVAVSSMEQLNKDVMTLSLVPKSRWQTLLHLDLIKQRNKPKEPPKAPEQAPFFLSLTGNVNTNEDAGDTVKISAAEKSRIMGMGRLGSESEFTILLRESSRTRDWTPFLAHLKSLSPSATDLEIRSLDPLKPYTELTNFVLALTSRLRARQDYELVQVWMTVFLKVHGESVACAAKEEEEEGGEGLVGALKDWRVEQERETGRLGELVGECVGLVGFLRGR